jgi:soluble P-type ATPase
MILLLRPGQPPLEIDFILINFDGTLAVDRRVHPKTKDKLNLLARQTKILVLTTQENGWCEEVLRKVKAEIIHLREGGSGQEKLTLLNRLGAPRTVAIGNGWHDIPMIEQAGLGICVIGREGTSGELIRKADLVFTSTLDALDFLLKPLRQKATLGQ